jgi:hypothetical protein
MKTSVVCVFSDGTVETLQVTDEQPDVLDGSLAVVICGYAIASSELKATLMLSDEKLAERLHRKGYRVCIVAPRRDGGAW